MNPRVISDTALSVPNGSYSFYLPVTQRGLDNYYLWNTSFVVQENPVEILLDVSAITEEFTLYHNGSSRIRYLANGPAAVAACRRCGSR